MRKGEKVERKWARSLFVLNAWRQSHEEPKLLPVWIIEHAGPRLWPRFRIKLVYLTTLPSYVLRAEKLKLHRAGFTRGTRLRIRNRLLTLYMHEVNARTLLFFCLESINFYKLMYKFYKLMYKFVITFNCEPKIHRKSKTRVCVSRVVGRISKTHGCETVLLILLKLRRKLQIEYTEV